MFCLQSPFTLINAKNLLICSSSTASRFPALAPPETFPIKPRARLSRNQSCLNRGICWNLKYTSIFLLVPNCQRHVQGLVHKPSCSKHYNTESTWGFFMCFYSHYNMPFSVVHMLKCSDMVLLQYIKHTYLSELFLLVKRSQVNYQAQ